MDLDCAPSYSIPNDLDSDPDDPYLDKVRVDSDRPDPDKDRPDPNYDEVRLDSDLFGRNSTMIDLNSDRDDADFDSPNTKNYRRRSSSTLRSACFAHSQYCAFLFFQLQDFCLTQKNFSPIADLHGKHLAKFR